MKIVACLLLFLVGFTVPAFADPKRSGSRIEQFVLSRLAEGKVANIAAEFPNEADRELSAAFLQDLISNRDQKFRSYKNEIQIHGALIREPINLSSTEVSQAIDLSHCHFTDVRFFQTVFKNGLWLRGAKFTGNVYFSATTVNAALFLTDAEFKSKDKTTDFTGLKVNGHAVFDRATFQGPVIFAFAAITGVFQMQDTKLLDVNSEANFNYMDIGRSFFATDAKFKGGVDMNSVRIGESFDGTRAEFKMPADKNTRIEMSTRGNLILKDAQFAGYVDFKNTSVGQLLDLGQTEFESAPNLSRVTYGSIYRQTRLVDLLKNSPSDYTAYNELESYLQRTGSTGEADEVFIEKKLYERRQGLPTYALLKSYVSELLTGFGRQPYRVLYLDFVIVIVGAALFRQRKMVLKSKPEVEPDTNRTDKETPAYNAFLYSLTLFAPAIDSQYTNNWKLAPEHRKTKIYHRSLRYAGYVLVPLTIAIWTGIFQ